MRWPVRPSARNAPAPAPAPAPRPARAAAQGLRLAIACTAVLLSAGCATNAPAPAPQPGLMDVIERPAEGALLSGMRAYDDGQYADAEKALNAALKGGLPAAKDRAQAHKLLAFIYCTSDRAPLCEAAFRSAKAALPGFALSRSEAGHPQWGPVFKRLGP